MPVQIPRLQRVQPSADLPKNNRLNIRAQNNAQDILGNNAAVRSVVKQGAGIYERYEDDAIEKISNEAELEYAAWNNQQLQGLKQIKGDATEAYVQHDENAEKMYTQLLNKRDKVSDRVSDAVAGRLRKVQDRQNLRTLNQRGVQQESYDLNLYKATKGLKKQDLAIDAGLIRKEDDSSMFAFDRGVSDLQQLVIKRGIKNGTVEDVTGSGNRGNYQYTDASGIDRQLIVSPIAGQDLIKEMNDSVGNSIEVLLASGNLKEAEMVQEKYKDYLDPLTLEKLKTKFNKGSLKAEAYAKINSMRGLTPEQQLKKLTKMPESELKTEVLKLREANLSKLNSDRNRQFKLNNDVMLNQAIDRMSGSNPYHGVADLEADPKIAPLWDRTTPEAKKAAIAMIKAPKVSTPGSVFKMQNLIFGNNPDFKIETMSPSEFSMFTSTLNASDRKRYTGVFEKRNSPSASRERSRNSRAEKFLQQELFRVRYLKKDNGFLTERSERRLTEVRKEMIDVLSPYGSEEINDKQLLDIVRGISQAKKDGEIYKAPERKVFRQPTPNVKTTGKAAIGKKLKGVTLSPKVRFKLKAAFRKENGHWPSEAEWSAILKANGHK